MEYRYKLEIEYVGTNYCGFQKQPKDSMKVFKKSIEGVIEEAFLEILSQKIKIAVCGRTDSGVHAKCQVIHVDLKEKIDCFKLMMGLNHFLKNNEISVISCKEVENTFHARFSAISRSYEYVIINRRAPLAIEKNRAWHVPLELDINKMQEAANLLVGKHDFKSFQDSTCQAKDSIKDIKYIKIEKQDEKITIKIKANAFLKHMVRNIVGSLQLVGNNKIAVSEVKNMLLAKQRTSSGPNAPACGLYFVGAEFK